MLGTVKFNAPEIPGPAQTDQRRVYHIIFINKMIIGLLSYPSYILPPTEVTVTW